jgi:hypothetical protein
LKVSANKALSSLNSAIVITPTFYWDYFKISELILFTRKNIPSLDQADLVTSMIPNLQFTKT